MSIKNYKPCLVQLMNYLDSPNPRYSIETEFDEARLLRITDKEVYSWLCMKAYGKADATSEDNPIGARSNSIHFSKKAVSFFMPNKNTQWCVRNKCGNPTRSTLVNELIKMMKKKEVRKQGKPSQARRACEIDEFRQLVKGLQNSNKKNLRYVVSCMAKFQFSCIARLDDTARLEKQNLTANTQFPFTLHFRLCWSKNVREERDAPEQIIFGAQDYLFCALLGLAVHLEVSLQQGTARESIYVFSLGGNNERGAKRTKDQAYTAIREIFESDSFIKSSGGNLGTHSLRKLPATYARRNGCRRDDIDVRGRWKKNTRQVDTYIDPSLPYPDAKVASVLCIGGAIKYMLREGLDVDDVWVAEHVVPNINTGFGAAVAKCLGLAFLWCCFDNEASNWLPPDMVARVKENYNTYSNDQDTLNPVEKVRR